MKYEFAYKRIEEMNIEIGNICQLITAKKSTNC